MEKQSRTNPLLGQSIPVRYDEVKRNYSLSRCLSSASSLSEVGTKLRFKNFMQLYGFC